MRLQLPLGRKLFVAVTFLLALIALLPLRLAMEWLALGRQGIVAREAVGSVWAGVLHQAQYRDTQLGDLVAELGALPLLAGRARIELGRNNRLLDGPGGRSDRFEGAVSVSRHSYAVGDVTARLPLGTQFAPLPITAIDLSDVSARFVDGLCAAAEGLVTIETSGNVAGLALPTTMSGNARCDQGALLLPLASGSGMEQLALHLTGGDRYRATLSIRPTDPTLQQRLALAGFVGSGGVYSLRVEGRFQ